MTIKYFIAWVLVLCPFLAVKSSFGQSPEEILRMSISLEQLPKYKTDFELILPSGTVKTKTHGLLYGVFKPDGSVRKRSETVTEVLGTQIKIETESITVGGKTFQIFPDQKRVVESAAEGADQLQLATFLSDQRNFTLKMRPERLEKKNFYVLVMTYLEPALKKQQELAKKMNLKVPVIASQEKWIDAENYVVSQTLSYDAEQHLVTGIKYSNIQTNVDLAENLFEIPTNFTVVSVNNNQALIKEVVNQTVKTVLYQANKASKESQANVGRKRTTGQYVILGLVLLQGIGVFVWAIIKYKRKLWPKRHG